MSTWNYRILKRKYKDEYQYELVEAYYTKKHKLNGYTKEPIAFVGSTAMEVIEGVQRAMNDILQRPVIGENQQEIESIFGGKPRIR